MSIVLATLAVAVMWWPTSRVEHRMSTLTGMAATRWTRLQPSTFGLICAPLVALLVGGIAGAVAASIAVGLVVWLRRRRARAAEHETQRDEMLTALALMIAELSVGAPPAHACAVAAQEISRGREVPSEVAEGLTVLAARAELGGSVVVDEVSDRRGQLSVSDSGSSVSGGSRSAAQSWRRIAVAWRTAEHSGVPMGELLESLRADLAARRAFIERTRAGLAGPRATAVVLAGLPLLGIALGQATGARPIQVLLGGGLGGMLLVIGTALVAAGMVWTERITDRVVRG
ncbi:type II secretion system F family protein [Gordonia jacobaea]|uniref:type II secretion system F family protein n=1 Tax=Gordonia jacobaea TaxID=122202 RepID=UPI003D74630C